MSNSGDALVVSGDDEGVDELRRDKGSLMEWSSKSIASRNSVEGWPEWRRAEMASVNDNALSSLQDRPIVSIKRCVR
jgi:hypothetical protein